MSEPGHGLVPDVWRLVRRRERGVLGCAVGWRFFGTLSSRGGSRSRETHERPAKTAPARERSAPGRHVAGVACVSAHEASPRVQSPLSQPLVGAMDAWIFCATARYVKYRITGNGRTASTELI